MKITRIFDLENVICIFTKNVPVLPLAMKVEEEAMEQNLGIPYIEGLSNMYSFCFRSDFRFIKICGQTLDNEK